MPLSPQPWNIQVKNQEVNYVKFSNVDSFCSQNLQTMSANCFSYPLPGLRPESNWRTSVPQAPLDIAPNENFWRRHWLLCLQFMIRFYPNVTTLRSGLCYRKPVCLSVTFVHPIQTVEAFGNISSPLCTLAIVWPPCKILQRSSQGNLSTGGVKHKRGSKIQRFWTCRRLYLTNGSYKIRTRVQLMTPRKSHTRNSLV